jgi:hypothetical protein
MKTNLFSVTIKKSNNFTDTFYVKGGNITDAVNKTYQYIDSIKTTGVEPASIEEIKMIGKILI